MPETRTPLQQLAYELHDLCQPVSTLQCRLQYAQMVGADVEFRNAVTGALADCEAITAAVHSMRACLHAVEVGR